MPWSSLSSKIQFKVQQGILIPYTFYQIQRIAPQSPKAVHSVCALKFLVFTNQQVASEAQKAGVSFEWL